MFSELYSNAIITCTTLMSRLDGLTFNVESYRESNNLHYGYARIRFRFEHHKGYVVLNIEDKAPYTIWCDVIDSYDEKGNCKYIHRDAEHLFDYLYHLLALLKERANNTVTIDDITLDF